MPKDMRSEQWKVREFWLSAYPNFLLKLILGSRFPRQCITTLRGQCPRSFACKAAQSGGLFYCCPVSPNECANGQKAFIPAGSSFPQTCSSYGGSNCAPGYR